MLAGKKAYLADINTELINAYTVVKNNPDALITELTVYKNNHNKDFYYQTRALDRSNDFKSLSELDRATRFIYLNKTCFNGLYRVNQKGYFNTPIGSYQNPNIADKEVILNASKALQNAIICNQSFDKTINSAKQGDFIYLDPPYYPFKINLSLKRNTSLSICTSNSVFYHIIPFIKICFNVFLNQNYELQFSCNVIITCNKKQYIVNYKQQFSFSYYS
jgi:DNA adenine methylase